MKIRGTTITTPVKPEVVLVKCKNLTEAQKAQARANIGAAAIGEGGGGSSEDAVLAVLVDLGMAPVLLDADGAVLVDGNDAILVNN